SITVNMNAISKTIITTSRRKELDFIKECILENGSKSEADLNEADKPLFLKAAERLAERRGTTAKEVLGSISSRLRRSKYPTPDCLTPYEVDQYSASSEIPPEQQAHIRECAFCSALLNARPKPELVRDFQNEVASFSGKTFGSGKP